MNTQKLYKILTNLPATKKMPALFIGHGSPMNAIQDNVFSRTWRDLGKWLPYPNAILSISAHWITPKETKVTIMTSPKTIHDFYGFPESLFLQQYPAPGAVDYASHTIELMQKSHVKSDHEWGLDHGTWSVLIQMYPKADIPVYQLSLDYSRPPVYHYEIAKDLKKLREKGVLIIGSGNMVHNLRMMHMNRDPYDWAIEFDRMITGYINNRDFHSAAHFQDLGNLAKMAHPTHDHYLPLMYILALAEEHSNIIYFNEGFDLSSVSMKSFVVI